MSITAPGVRRRRANIIVADVIFATLGDLELALVILFDIDDLRLGTATLAGFLNISEQLGLAVVLAVHLSR